MSERPSSITRPTLTTGPVNLNKATQAELEGLPGVGPTLAAKIITGRPFASVGELDRVQGIGPELMAKLRPLVTAR